LLTVPGSGEMMSLVILYEIGKISRIESAQKFSSYCRLVKCERESGGKKYHGRNQKIGNPYLKWAIGEIIIHARRTVEGQDIPQFRSKGFPTQKCYLAFA
jgi:transposase